MAIAIRAKGLTKRFGPNVALDGLDLEIASGEVFGLLGHNGAGKTTTIRLLNGILSPDAGEASVLGLSPQSEGERLRARTGVLTEAPSIDERLTAREHLTAFAALYSIERPGPRVAEVLQQFGLAQAADRRLAGFSRGMRQRVALARALLHDPEVIFLDEPTTGLDPVASHEVRLLIQDLSSSRGRTVLLCTHNLDEASRLCHRVAVLRAGRVVAMGSPSSLSRSVGPYRVEIDVVAGGEEAAQGLLTRSGAKATVRPSHVGSAGAGITTLDVTGLRPDDIPDLIAALVKGGVRVARVSPQEGTLEEFYLRLDRGRSP
ncbi:MAG: ABC transporter ATP-binding protein [Thermoplasmatota archaeon]